MIRIGIPTDSQHLAGWRKDYDEIVGLKRIPTSHPQRIALDEALELLESADLIVRDDVRCIQVWLGCERVSDTHEHGESCAGRWAWVTEVEV